MKKLVWLLVAVLCMTIMIGSSATAEYPERSITVVVPFGAGGEHDMVARVIAQQMQKWGYTFVVQNTTNSSGTTIDYLNDKKKHDGYTLLMHSHEVMASQYLSGSVPYEVHDKIVYLGNFVFDPLILCVAKDSPYNSLQDIIDAAKEKPDEIKWASVSASGKNAWDAQYLYGLFDAQFLYVPYENASLSRAAVMGGHAEVYHAYVSGAKISIDAGELKPIAVGAPERVPFLPDVPTLKELGYDAEVGLTRCWDISPEVDQAIIDRLVKDLKECLESEETQTALYELGATPVWRTPEEMLAYGQEQFDIYKGMLDAGIIQ